MRSAIESKKFAVGICGFEVYASEADFRVYGLRASRFFDSIHTMHNTAFPESLLSS